jgi:3-keto-5-aminohexanoate cleavage enzyme
MLSSMHRGKALAIKHYRFSQHLSSRSNFFSTISTDKVVVTAALNGVLTDPAKFDIPVTPDEMATAASEAYDAGASVVHVHFRDQRPGKGHLPSWEPKDAKAISDAIREACPDILVNFTTGTIGTGTSPLAGGKLGPTEGPISCLKAGLPEIAALNSGSLNYLKSTSKGEWAWKPLMFENPVEKIELMLHAMQKFNIKPECECFDTGIVRSIKMFESVGLMDQPINLSLVMGVASGMPCKPEWIELLKEEMNEETQWQVIAIGRDHETWPTLRRAAELGGHVRTGLEDTFYLPGGNRATTSGQLIENLVRIVREVGREPATPDETRIILGTK